MVICTEIEYVNERRRFIKKLSLQQEKRWILFNNTGSLMFVDHPVYTVHVAYSTVRVTA